MLPIGGGVQPRGESAAPTLLGAGLLAVLLALTACATTASRGQDAGSRAAESAGSESRQPAGSTGSSAQAPPSADAPEVTGRQVMVMLRPAPPQILGQVTQDLATMHGLRIVFAWQLASLGERCVVFEIPQRRDASAIAKRLRASPGVLLAQPIHTFQTLGATTGAPATGSAAANAVGAGGPTAEPYAYLQHAATQLNLAAAHRYATGRGVKVAVVDTGVDVDHPDLRGRIARVSNFVDRGEQTFTSDIHGTAVAGALAAGRNAIGILGVAPEAELFALKACWPPTPGVRQALCNSYTLARALDFAIVEGAQVLNVSLAGPADPLLERLIRNALERGIVVVAAADSSGPAGADGFPASVDGVLAVTGAGAAGDAGTTGVPARAPGANTVAAPSVDILSTVPRGAYDFFSGSSLAAAQVSGIAALLLQLRPTLSPAEVSAAILATARTADREVDACAAIRRVEPSATCTPAP